MGLGGPEAVQWAVGFALFVQGLPHEHEDMSSIPRTRIKKSGHGGRCFSSQHKEEGHRWIPVACWWETPV